MVTLASPPSGLSPKIPLPATTVTTSQAAAEVLGPWPSPSGPLAGAAFSEKASAAAWKAKPSWGSVATADHSINPDVERFSYQRAGTTVTEIDSSHLVMQSHPKEVADIIRTAIEATTA